MRWGVRAGTGGSEGYDYRQGESSNPSVPAVTAATAATAVTGVMGETVATAPVAHLALKEDMEPEGNRPSPTAHTSAGEG